jgi:ATP-dependent helicase/nuclease subunit B
LNADPYAFYARKMLKLATLDAVDADPGPAWRGTLVHDALDKWAREDRYAPDALPQRIAAALASPGIHPLIRALWQPRFDMAAKWIAQTVDEDVKGGRVPLVSEQKGSIELGGVALNGVADRIDRVADGAIAIVDYKTGLPPSKKQVAAGLALQLGLIALIAERGGFAGVKGKADAFEYWSLGRAKDRSFGFRTSPTGAKDGIAAEDFVAYARRQLDEAVATWLTGDAPFRAKRHPDYAYADYDHLMRLEEWQGRDG